MATLTALPSGKSEITDAAKAAWDAAKGKPYKWGGHDINGFDCSGFVCYVLRLAYPARNFTFLTAEQLFTDIRFVDIADSPKYGDLICFKKQAELTHNHIGLVYDMNHWIGSQSSTGVAPVLFANFWWSQKSCWFRRLVVNA